MSHAKRYIRWYLSAWWKPMLPLLAVGAACAGSGALSLFLSHGVFWRAISEWTFLLLLLFLPIQFIVGIIHFYRRCWMRGFLVWLSGAVGFCGIVVLAFVLYWGHAFKDEDHFADNLTLPENVALAEPLNDGYQPFDNPHKAPDGSFQKQILSVIGSGPKLEPDATCRIQSLEKLMSTPEGLRKLKDYLYANPEWTVTRSPANGLFATKNFRHANGSINVSLHGFYSHFSSQNLASEPKFQYRFYISLDGKPWSRNLGQTPHGQEITVYENPGNGMKYHAWTWFDAGGAKVVISDQSDYEGRQMTAKTLELAEKEFAELALPADAIVTNRQPGFVIYDGTQGGIYIMDVVCNPGEPGMLYIKANEITTGAKLSEHRLAEKVALTFGSDNEDELYRSRWEFKIYEGNWEQHYGARIEVWFKPDSGKTDRKLFEKNYKIQGWMR